MGPPRARASASRRGPLALSLALGIAVGLLVAARQFRGPSGSSSISGGGSGGTNTAPSITRAQVQRLMQERDAAQQEVATLRGKLAAASSAAGVAAAQQAQPECTDRHTPWSPSPDKDKLYPELAAFLKKVLLLGAGALAVDAGTLCGC